MCIRDRPYTDQLIADYAEGCNVDRIGSSELVQLAEQYWLTGQLDAQALDNILLPWIEQATLDQIILGCTHFPILSEEISRRYPHIGLVDSGQAIARRLCFILQQQGHDLALLQQPSTQHSLLSTAAIANKEAFFSACQRIAPYQSFNII